MLILKLWYLEVPRLPEEFEKTEPTIRIDKKALLKTGFRGSFIDDIEYIRDLEWFDKYINGEKVDFYIEGSGTYKLENMDLLSREMYFTRTDALPHLPPYIFYCYQTDYHKSNEMIEKVLEEIINNINNSSPAYQISIKKAIMPGEGAKKIDSDITKKIEKSIIFVADVTPILAFPNIDNEKGTNSTKKKAFSNPNVLIETGYALTSKPLDRIKLIQIERDDFKNIEFPFDIGTNARIIASDIDKLRNQLTEEINETLKNLRIINI